MARISGSMSSLLNLVPLIDTLAEEPNNATRPACESRVMAAWNGPALTSMRSVPSRVLRSIMSSSEQVEDRVLAAERGDRAQRQVVACGDGLEHIRGRDSKAHRVRRQSPGCPASR